MSKALLTNRRLLWSIIHSLPQPPHTYTNVARRAQTKASLTTSARTSNGPSISFGSPEADAMIARMADDNISVQPEESLSDPLPEQRGGGGLPDTSVQLLPVTNDGHNHATHTATSEKSQKRRARGLHSRSIKSTSASAAWAKASRTPAEEFSEDSIPFEDVTSDPRPNRRVKNTMGSENPPHTALNLPPRRNTAKMEPWQIQKSALQDKFSGTGWNPRKKLSPDAQEGIRNLHAQDPERYTTPQLAEHFKVSPEAIRRILKSKWQSQQDGEKLQERRERWAKRHDRIWDQQAALGLRPQRTKPMKLEDPDTFEQELRARQILEAARNV